MAKVLSISSQVVHGHVGNSIAAFVLQRMGHDVLSLPTIILSNRPGYPAIAGTRIAPDTLEAMLDAVLANGWLQSVDAIMTGYLPSAAHAELCAAWIARVQALNPGLIYFCDPILGDEPGGIYIEEAAAKAVRALLVPLAGILTPNSFELSWISGRTARTPADTVSAARSLRRPAVIVTSAHSGALDELANILVEGEAATMTKVHRRTVEAHGTGDFFASILLAHRLGDADNAIALSAATAAIDAVLDASVGLSELKLIESQAVWAHQPPAFAPLVSIPPGGGAS
jgi:pyridoxine kinase